MKKKQFGLVAILIVTLVASLALVACDVLVGYGWRYDETTHWRQSFLGDKSDAAEHVFSAWVTDKNPTETEAGSHYRKCEICGYKQTETIPALGADHAHIYDIWTPNSDGRTHYAKCVCGDVANATVNEHSFGGWVVDVPATTTSAGTQHRTCTLCSYVETAAISKLDPSSVRTVDFYAINDFHGAYEKMSNIAGYLADQKSGGNTLLVNSGDMFQGSIQSNSNYGAMLSECMRLTGFDAFTFGNHEFDWGLDNLRQLAANSSVPFLGANIYNWNASAKTWGDFASDLAKEYTIQTLSNGLKVGIIGVIGKDQITSISSQLVQTIGFKDPKEIVPTLSNKLRNELGCDVVVVSAHTGPETFLEDSSWDITAYADAVFCAHTHSAETNFKNGVPFIQGGSKGSYVSHVQLTVSSNGNVGCEVNENISYSYSWAQNNNNIDDLVAETINNSNANIRDEANKVVATFSQTLYSSTELPRLVARAMAEYAISQGHNDIVLAMVNNARATMYSGTRTYDDLFEAIPFDNVVYVAKVSGYDILAEAGYSSNSIWRVSGAAIQNSTTVYYKIVVIDYLLYHQNANRNYNYFSSFTTSGFTPVPLTNDGADYNYRLITRDFLMKQSGTVDVSVYKDSYYNSKKGANDNTNADNLTQAVDLPISYSTTAMDASVTVSLWAVNQSNVVCTLYDLGTLSHYAKYAY